MKSSIFFLALTAFVNLYSQNVDYNQKQGYIAGGYDVVSYFNNDPQKGNEEFTIVHDNAKFRFKSQENLAAFQANPEKYIPQYGGWCAYAMAKGGKKVTVNPKTYEIRDGKLYLFYNKRFNNTLKSWIKEKPSALIPKADMSWKKIRYKRK